LRRGVTVDGIRYGEIEATLDRVQASNLWLTFAIREGKKHEVRNVLGHLNLAVTRLIRVSFGPFQLDELADGAVEEVRTAVLREQLGARLAATAGVDFSTPIGNPPAVAREAVPRATKHTKSTSHAWRTHEGTEPKKLRRQFHGSRRDAETPQPPPAQDARLDEITDRKGRRVAVARFGRPPQREEAKKEPPKRGRRRGSSDRASGPRPRHPRARR
jgi:23S rRNA pseudouridine2605 synthase